MAKIFIGSSTEAEQRGVVRRIARWIAAAGHEPMSWKEPGVFLPGHALFQRLVELSRQVDAAVLVFAEDDRVWYREDQIGQPRANVLIEYGLFSGALGPARTVICRDGSPHTPTDLGGVVYVDMRAGRIRQAGRHFKAWARTLDAGPAPEAYARQILVRYREHVHWWTTARPIQPNRQGEPYVERFGSAPVWAYMRPPSELIHCHADSNAYRTMRKIEQRLLDYGEKALPVAIAVDAHARPIGVATPSDLVKLDRWLYRRKAPVSDVWFGPPHALVVCLATETCRSAYRTMLQGSSAPILTGLPVVDRDGRLVGFLPHHGGREDWEALHPAGRAS
jgi:hypothetical protein